LAEPSKRARTLTDTQVETASQGGQPSSGRRDRLVHGWSANLVQTLLGLSQQLLLIPAFLHFWTSDRLAAWLAVYAAGSLVVLADAGLQMRAINRFLSFKSCADCDGRTASFYARMLRIYLAAALAASLVILVMAQLLPPSEMLGFRATPGFDSALIVMTLGMVFIVPSNLVSGLYRVRGKYGRTVWLQNAALLLGQIAQLVAIAVSGSLLAVAIAYVSVQLALAVFLLAIDAPRQFPFLRGGRASPPGLRWSLGQFARAFPFAVAGVTELVLLNVPVLLVSALVVDRVAVAQWGLTRVIASLVRGLCLQAALPLAAELGHDYAIGDKERLRGLYATGSVLVTSLASVIVAGLLPFWKDFFALWTHGSIPYDGPLAVTLLLGSAAAAPSLMAFAFANHSNRGDLLMRTKGLQLIVFLVLSLVLIPRLGPLGAALAVVASDLVVQFGLLTLVIVAQTLGRPWRHVAFLLVVSLSILLPGWSLGALVAALAPADGLIHFLIECTTWIVVLGLVASPLLSRGFRARILGLIPT